MDFSRRNPDELLKVLHNEFDDGHKGELKIFFGYAAGVGKTYQMLEAAHKAKEQGIDVVVGYIEPHSRPQTTALLDGLEKLPTIQVLYGGIVLNEFDIDGALKRKPQLILVDEFAHTNAEGSRHIKRYQDIQELLNNGIDVYTTVNVQHLESLNDTVSSITGIQVKERIPDIVFDQATQVELVDIEPQELVKRMESGNIYSAEKSKQALSNFFTIENLTALRELALRRCADYVNLVSENARLQSNSDYHTDEHILVCLSSSPSNAKIIRTAYRMARAFHGSFTALYVETPESGNISDDDKKRLRENIRLAKLLGANIETTYGEDIPYQIAEFARLTGVSKIVIGRSNITRKGFFSKPTLTEKLITYAPSVDIHVIPDASLSSSRPSIIKRGSGFSIISIKDVFKLFLTLLATTLLGFVFYNLGFTEANIVSIYILGVFITSVITNNKYSGMLSSIVSVLVFNFFFTVPRYTFHFNDPNYWITFPVMFMVAMFTGSLAARLKENAKQSSIAAYRTKLLFETNQMLQKEDEVEGVINATANQIVKLLKRNIVFYVSEKNELSKPYFFTAKDEDDKKIEIDENEKSVALWAMRNNTPAGNSTDTLASAKYYYLPIRSSQNVFGVIGVDLNSIALDSFESSVLLSILGECGLALENIKNYKEKEEAAILAKNEQLRANLLRSISHDLRTPLTSISGNADNLITNYKKMDETEIRNTFVDIYDDSMWLINLVENLLAITKIEGGEINLKRSVELMDDVINEALKYINRKSVEHTIRVSSDQDFIIAKIDARLIVQVIVNLVDNAIKYTQKGSIIEIHTKKDGENVFVSISDNGPGIPDDQKEHIFDMFYCTPNKASDSRRSLGLGLSLCKSIVNVHGGNITVTDNKPCGSVFTFTLPAGEVNLDV